jgi:protein-S-isoprenylcysteine O-methyltransferase Ste14
MKSLELAIPPPVVALVTSLLMLAVASLAPVAEPPGLLRSLLALLAGLGGASCAGAGIAAFAAARTTVSPIAPHKATALVTTGVYQLTRNPMYLGLLLGLTGWAVYLGSWLTLLGPVGFHAYISRFQIAPEERILTELFGSAYADYRRQVRRWL